jgi:hypothetical protein
MTTTPSTETPSAFRLFPAKGAAARRIMAQEVERGDLLLLDGFISAVTGVNELVLAYPHHPQATSNWRVLHITGSVNIVRFPHEYVSVIRDGWHEEQVAGLTKAIGGE